MIVLAFESRSKECSASSLGTPGLSDGFHAKMSQFSRRKEDDGLGRHGWRELRLGSQLLGGDLLMVRREVLCFLSNKNRVPGSFQGFGEFDVLGLTCLGGLQISVDREDPLWSWHLQEKIRVVGDRHELGEGGSCQTRGSGTTYRYRTF